MTRRELKIKKKKVKDVCFSIWMLDGGGGSNVLDLQLLKIVNLLTENMFVNCFTLPII